MSSGVVASPGADAVSQPTATSAPGPSERMPTSVDANLTNDPLSGEVWVASMSQLNNRFASESSPALPATALEFVPPDAFSPDPGGQSAVVPGA